MRRALGGDSVSASASLPRAVAAASVASRLSDRARSSCGRQVVEIRWRAAVSIRRPSTAAAEQCQSRRTDQHASPADGRRVRLGTSNILPFARSGREFGAGRRRCRVSSFGQSRAGVSWIVGFRGEPLSGIVSGQLKTRSSPWHGRRSAGLPSQQQVIELLDGEFARAGYEIEDVVDRRVGPAAPDHGGRRRRRRSGPRLDRRAVPRRPPNCWMALDDVRRRRVRARGHLARGGPAVDHREALPPGPGPQGRDDAVRRIAADRAAGRDQTGPCGSSCAKRRGDLAVRELPLETIAKAVVQVEFSPPNQRELELAGRNPERRPEHEHRHGGAARDRGRQGNLGRRGASIPSSRRC